MRAGVKENKKTEKELKQRVGRLNELIQWHTAQSERLVTATSPSGKVAYAEAVKAAQLARSELDRLWPEYWRATSQ